MVLQNFSGNIKDVIASRSSDMQYYNLFHKLILDYEQYGNKEYNIYPKYNSNILDIYNDANIRYDSKKPFIFIANTGNGKSILEYKYHHPALIMLQDLENNPTGNFLFQPSNIFETSDSVRKISKKLSSNLDSNIDLFISPIITANLESDNNKDIAAIASLVICLSYPKNQYRTYLGLNDLSYKMLNSIFSDYYKNKIKYNDLSSTIIKACEITNKNNSLSTEQTTQASTDKKQNSNEHNDKLYIDEKLYKSIFETNEIEILKYVLCLIACHFVLLKCLKELNLKTKYIFIPVLATEILVMNYIFNTANKENLLIKESYESLHGSHPPFSIEKSFRDQVNTRTINSYHPLGLSFTQRIDSKKLSSLKHAYTR